MRTLYRDGHILPAKWYELRLRDRCAAVQPLELRFYVEFWRTYRWCLEWWGVERGWFGVREDGGYFSEGRWAGIGENFLASFTLLPPDECKPPWNRPDRLDPFFARRMHESGVWGNG